MSCVRGELDESSSCGRPSLSRDHVPPRPWLSWTRPLARRRHSSPTFAWAIRPLYGDVDTLRLPGLTRKDPSFYDVNLAHSKHARSRPASPRGNPLHRHVFTSPAQQQGEVKDEC